VTWTASNGKCVFALTCPLLLWSDALWAQISGPALAPLPDAVEEEVPGPEGKLSEAPRQPCEGVTCPVNASCNVMSGGAMCACDAGYVESLEGGLACIPRHEEVVQHVSLPHDACTNVDCPGRNAKTPYCIAVRGSPICLDARSLDKTLMNANLMRAVGGASIGTGLAGAEALSAQALGIGTPGRGSLAVSVPGSGRGLGRNWRLLLIQSPGECRVPYCAAPG
jgi:hypothetical protein